MSATKNRSMPPNKPAPLWYLDDAAVRAENNPYTFYKPSEQAISGLQAGNHAQLIFAIDSQESDMPGAERMWVKIDRIEGATFYGTLANDPVFIDDLIAGEPIVFTARHIIDLDIDDPVPDPTVPYQARCVVTKSVLAGRKRAGSVFRVAPISDRDSGWRILAGGESKQDLIHRHQFVSLGAVLSRDDSFVALLQTPAPCAFVRNESSKSFSPITVAEMQTRIRGPLDS